MRSMIGWLARRRGWVAGVATALAGAGLVAADRVAAVHVGERAWVVQPAEDPEWPEESWKSVAFARVPFDGAGRPLKDVVAWVQLRARGRFDLWVNWLALEEAGVGRDAPFPFDGKDVSLAALLDAMAARVGERAGTLAWEAEGGGTIYLTSAAELAGDRRWRAQRAAAAPAGLRRQLDRPIPCAAVPDLRMDEALRLYARLSGVRIRLDRLSGDQTVGLFEPGTTFERALELILRRGGGRTTLRLRVEGDGLVVFADEGGR